MKAEQINLEEIINFNEGKLDFQGRRLVIHDMRAFAQFRKDIIDLTGITHAKRILTRFGYFWGQADASAMNRIYSWDNIEEWIKAGVKLHSLQGVVKGIIKEIQIDSDKKTFFMELIWHNSGEAMEHISELDYSNYPVCWMLTGYMSGYSSYCLNTDIYFIEKLCVGKKDKHCYAIGKDLKSWGEEINEYLPQFHINGIKSKIINYREEIKNLTRKILQQQKKINNLQKGLKPFIEEIHSCSFKKVIEIANRASLFDTSILITGETGTGKEVLAKYIHNISNRKKSIFQAINCGALPETLAESELFGHVAGAFTGAIKDHIGLLEIAKGGTILLDEIGDISLNLQIKILRVLQEKEIFRIGENKSRKIDVRIIAATNKNLKSLIDEKTFREDLYYRLKVIEIKIPPLRERKEDIIILIRYFINYFSKKLNIPKLKIHTTCYKILENYYWPGNVRELENVIERAAVLSENFIILPEHLPDEITSNINSSNNNITLKDLEIEYIKKVLKNVNNNKTRACKILGISQTSLWRKLNKMNF